MTRITSRVSGCLLSSVIWAVAWPESTISPTTAPMLYDVTTETGMPHLEENLRYTTTHERRCVARSALFSAFPILTHPALKGCQLKNPTSENDLLRYVLVCDGNHGTTGAAIWHLGPQRLRGTLNVKLGGKNMTFYQRITAVSRGECIG
jgi:hypothetical protein